TYNGTITITSPGASNTPVTVPVTLTVTAVNDAPVNIVPGPQTINEDASRIFSAANGNAISVGDIDDGDDTIIGNEPLQVMLSVNGGTLTLASITGLTFSAGDGTADATMTFTGMLSNINSALNGLSTFSSQSGPQTLTLTTSDQGNFGSGGALSTTSTVAITVSPANDAPVNTVPGPQATNEDTALVFSAGNGNLISVSDV